MIRSVKTMLMLNLVVTIAVTLTATISLAQAAPAQSDGRSFVVADVLKLLQVGLEEDVVVARIKKEGKAFDLSTDDFIALKKAGASSLVLKTLMNPGSSLVLAGAPVAQPSDLPDEQGVYVRVRGEWKAIEPEIVNVRTANMLGHALSYGIAKAKFKGDVEGTRSKMQIAGPVELLIKCSDGTSATEYNIVKMEEKAGRREVEMAEIGMISAKGGVRKGVVSVKFEKVGKSTYKGLLSNVARGEYGVLPPGAATSATTASAGKVYTFGIIE